MTKTLKDELRDCIVGSLKELECDTLNDKSQEYLLSMICLKIAIFTQEQTN